MNYSRDALRHQLCKHIRKRGLPLASMEIGYVERDAAKWEVDPERDASKFDAIYYGKPLEIETAWDGVSCVLTDVNRRLPVKIGGSLTMLLLVS